VAAGWPSWLSAVAAEAIQGWIPLKADNFQKLEQVLCLLSFRFMFSFHWIRLIFSGVVFHCNYCFTRSIKFWNEDR
jgi:hypothetical protein